MLRSPASDPNPVVDTGTPPSPDVKLIPPESGKGGSALRSYPVGHASRCRGKLIRAEGLLAQVREGGDSLSRISISALEKAVSTFLEESRLGAARGLSEGSIFNPSTRPGLIGSRKPPEDYEHKLSRLRRQRQDAKILKNQNQKKEGS